MNYCESLKSVQHDEGDYLLAVAYPVADAPEWRVADNAGDEEDFKTYFESFLETVDPANRDWETSLCGAMHPLDALCDAPTLPFEDVVCTSCNSSHLSPPCWCCF